MKPVQVTVEAIIAHAKSSVFNSLMPGVIATKDEVRLIFDAVLQLERSLKNRSLRRIVIEHFVCEEPYYLAVLPTEILDAAESAEELMVLFPDGEVIIASIAV